MDLLQQMENILDKAQLWLSDTFDTETQKEVAQLITSKSDDLADRFYKDLEFGTGGMRGMMGAGTNRINKYTLGKATQGLSNYLRWKGWSKVYESMLKIATD